MTRTARGSWPGALAMALALCLGCRPAGPPPPKTYPVHGRVVSKDGQPLAGVEELSVCQRSRPVGREDFVGM